MVLVLGKMEGLETHLCLPLSVAVKSGRRYNIIRTPENDRNKIEDDQKSDSTNPADNLPFCFLWFPSVVDLSPKGGHVCIDSAP